jgi:SAM-dependent methyltransferase
MTLEADPSRVLYRSEGIAPVPEYVDYAEYYDLDHNTQVDVAFYLDFARQCGSPILELACSTGRLVIPLAEAGFEVYGYELQLLLERAGFEIVDIFRDYDKHPYDGTGEIIAVARRPQRGRSI